nr:MAG: hypothetical protein [Bacteriophage sp.]
MILSVSSAIMTRTLDAPMNYGFVTALTVSVTYFIYDSEIGKNAIKRKSPVTHSKEPGNSACDAMTMAVITYLSSTVVFPKRIGAAGSDWS